LEKAALSAAISDYLMKKEKIKLSPQKNSNKGINPWIISGRNINFKSRL
jgi:hypothetical protein